jgi:LAS superfamily LD-carboxypeptidase LdcB
MNIDILLGKTTEHLVPLEGTKYLIHKMVLTDFLRLQRDALMAGFDLQICSAFRDYERQLKIWNLKASGERQLMDSEERPLEFSSLSQEQIVMSILRWSALPGSSRHHWGTDIDVFDAKTQRIEDVKLVPSETMDQGPAANLHRWLDEKISSSNSYGFFRPYATDRGGVSPERWHLSYYPLSRRYLGAYTFSIFKRNISESSMLLKDVVLSRADDIFQRFFLNVDLP